MTEQCELCAQFIQDGTVAFAAFNKGKGKGKSKGPMGKGKGGSYPVRPSNLSVEDRRKKLQELEAKTECKDCGRRGHWAGDNQCTMKGTKAARLSVVDRSIGTGKGINPNVSVGSNLLFFGVGLHFYTIYKRNVQNHR
jgi:hypothetical protein